MAATNPVPSTTASEKLTPTATPAALSEELAIVVSNPTTSAPPKGNLAPGEPNPKPENRRPEDLGKLLFEGDYHANFHSEHEGMNRFYVININDVFRTKLKLNPGKLSKYSDLIASETLPATWEAQYPGGTQDSPHF